MGWLRLVSRGMLRVPSGRWRGRRWVIIGKRYIGGWWPRVGWVSRVLGTVEEGSRRFLLKTEVRRELPAAKDILGLLAPFLDLMEQGGGGVAMSVIYIR